MRPHALLPVALLAAACASPVESDWLVDADTQAPLLSDAMRGRTARVVTPFVPGAGTPAAYDTDELRTLALFDDLVITARLDQLTQPGGNTVWTGHVDGWPDHEVVITQTRAGWVSGIVRAPEATVRIRPLGRGEVVIEEVGTRLGDVDLDPRLPLDLPAYDLPPVVPEESPPVIDVLIAATALTGSTLGGEEGLLTAAEGLVAQANKGYADSGLTTRLRLAGVHVSTWDEDGFAWADTLYALADTTDGVLDDVSTAREDLGADVVSLLVDGDGGACGLGFLMSPANPAFAKAAYSTVDLRCAASNLSFAHEIGHNLGLQHDRDHASSSPATTYAYGYQDPDEAFRTVMSYDCAGVSCPRLNLWSSPDVEVDGVPAGIEIGETGEAFNVAAINLTAPVVAAFRDPPEEGPEPVASTILAPASGTTLSGSTVAVAWTDVSALNYTLAVGTSPGGADVAKVDAGTKTTTVLAGLPTDGKPLYATLWSTFADESLTSSAVWTAQAPPAKVASLQSPTPGTQLDSTEATFTWTDVKADSYALVLGSSRFGTDLGTFGTKGTALTVKSLPEDGRTVWVSLYTQDGATWRSETVTYKAYDSDLDLTAPAEMLEPAPGGTLAGRTFTFRWTDPDAPAYALTLWSGETEVYHEIVAGTAATLTLPPSTPEGELTVRLATKMDGRWFSRMYIYTLN